MVPEEIKPQLEQPKIEGEPKETVLGEAAERVRVEAALQVLEGDERRVV